MSPSPGSEEEREALRPEHKGLIDGSAISSAVSEQRGYESIETKAELGRRGFSASQRRTPALFIPIWNVHGEMATCQIRPDQPRFINGKSVKYETPKGSRIVVDVPPCVRERLKDPGQPLFITEGVRKADAAATAGLCCIDILGVWNWRGTNEWGGTTALPDWELIALNGRTVYIVFDSDVMTKPQVHLALSRLKGFLESRRASVFVIYLPAGEGGTKVGLDDFFAAGNDVDDLLALATEELREPEGGWTGTQIYSETDDGRIVHHKPAGDSTVPVTLAYFTARIVAEVALDDGMEVRREYEIQAQVDGRIVTCSVPARSFAAMNWVNDALGARAIMAAGFGQRDHLRAAIQSLGGEIENRTVYGHSGWREISGVGYVYLHAAGAIGPNGPVPGIEVRLPQALHAMVLPDPPEGEELVADVRGALALIDLGPERLTFSLLAAAFRASMGDTDFSLFLFGVTDLFKTETAALIQSFYGTGFDARHLPGSWLSTGNALETLAFVAKDMITSVDDFVPTGSRQDIQRQHREAERVLRGQGNRAGRGRLGPDASLQEGRAPRGMILSTGEDLPARHSARARTLVLEVGKGDVNVERLTECQQRIARGVHARVMSAFLCWVAPRYKSLKKKLVERALELRALAQKDDRHRRTASIVGELQAGFELFLCFAVARAGLDKEESERLRRCCWAALLKAAAAQTRHLLAAEPASLFIRLLCSAVGSGAAHVAGPDGDQPHDPEALGWRLGATTGKNGSSAPIYLAQGRRVGWVKGDDLYLDPAAAVKAAQEMASDVERVPVTTSTLSKRLDEKGYLVSTEKERDHLTVRRVLSGARRNVLHLSLGVLTGAAQSAQPAPGRGPEARKGDNGPGAWANESTPPDGIGPQVRPTNAIGDAAGAGDEPNGPLGPESARHTPVGAGDADRDEPEEEAEWTA